MGMEGFVSLARAKLFCDRTCLRRHLKGHRVYYLKRRIP